MRLLCIIMCLFVLSFVLAVPFKTKKNNSTLSNLPDETERSLKDSISSGTRMAIEHCQLLFRWEKWNCPDIMINRQQKLTSTKEVAFTKAIIAAGIAHTITKNCSQGQIEGCKCIKTDKITPSTAEYRHYERLKIQNLNNFQSKIVNNGTNDTILWKWEGCSDNPIFAADVTTKFISASEKGFDVHAFLARHNSKIGIKIAENSMVRRCRCHGVSGSCTMQTCWMQTASFTEISRKLKELHRKAVRVSYNVVQNSILMGNSASEDYVEEKIIPGTENKLIYLDQSPDYCVTNIEQGIMGTKGRVCSRNRLNITKIEKNSCRNLCRKCGHSVKRLQKKVTRQCNCVFSWCCEVKCDTCTDLVDEYFCT